MGQTTLSISPRLLRCPEVCQQLGLPKSSLYAAIGKGLVPQPIAFGERTVAWPSHEIDAVIRSAMAAEPIEERRDLVRRLTAARAEGASLQ